MSSVEPATPTGTWAVVAARMGSSRLPGKSLALLRGRPAFARIVERLGRSRYLDGVVLATTRNREDQALCDVANELGVPFHRGSAEDVLERTLEAAQLVGAEVIVQVTGDCPLIDPAIVDDVIEVFRRTQPDYASNVIPATYPNGMDAEVFPTSVLATVERLTSDPADREHVSLYIYEHPERFRLVNVEAPPSLARPEVRLCVDTEEDLQVVRAVYDALEPVSPSFGLADMLAFLDSHPEISARNAAVRQKAARG